MFIIYTYTSTHTYMYIYINEDCIGCQMLLGLLAVFQQHLSDLNK